MSLTEQVAPVLDLKSRHSTPRVQLTGGKTLREVTDLQLLEGVGYDVGARIVRLNSAHPMMYRVCCRLCETSLLAAPKVDSDLCGSCANTYQRAGRPDLDTFDWQGRRAGADSLVNPPLCGICCTPGHERPAHLTSPLCNTHVGYADRRAKVDHEAYISVGTALPTLGSCAVHVCDRLAARRVGRHRTPLCEFHRSRSVSMIGRHGMTLDDFLATEVTAAAAYEMRKPALDLHGLHERVRDQVLAMLSLGLHAELKHVCRTVYKVIEIARAHDLQDLQDVVDWTQFFVGGTHNKNLNAGAVRTLLGLLRHATADPFVERTRDIWEMAVFGYPRGGKLHFNGSPGAAGRNDQPIPAISQTWLREAAKLMCWEFVAAKKSLTTLQMVIAAAAEFSITMSANREDRGEDPSVLGRDDITRHLHRLQRAADAGDISNDKHVRMFTYLRLLLRAATEQPDIFSSPGAPFEHLNPKCRFLPTDGVSRIKQLAEDEKAGSSLPNIVMRRLLSEPSLDILRATTGGEDIVAAVVLQANVGRRPIELVSLRWECLHPVETYNEDGELTSRRYDLIYDEPKKKLVRRYIPIHNDVAELIKQQQERVRQRFPDTPTAELALFPKVEQNKRGTKSSGVYWLHYHWRRWIDALGDVDGPDVDTDGRRIPFDKAKIDPYAFRHTYAQRHADAGVDPDVLRRLMGHELLKTTQGYYQVSRNRMRAAVELLGPLQFNAEGDKTTGEIMRIVDSDVDWLAMGGVSVSYGTCFEPTNIKAGGQACPFMHQCTGCGHFRTDPSHLPDLRHFLQRRLADAELLAAAVQAGLIKEWAAEAARPRDPEVHALRHLIKRCEDELARLDPQRRARLEATFDEMQAARQLIDEVLPDEARHAVRNPASAHVAVPAQARPQED